MDPLIPLFVADLQEDDFDLESEIGSMAATVGWPNVLKETMHVLDRSSKRSFWYQAACICYWAALDKHPLPFPREQLIARLYYCLEQMPGLGRSGLEDGENLVWSVATTLTGRPYDSSWDPPNDPEISSLISGFRSHS